MRNSRQLQEATRQFVYDLPWLNPVAATLTLKQARYFDGRRVALDEIIAQAALDHFLKKINRKVLGNKSKRGQILTSFACLEGGRGVRYHYHAMIDCPAGYDRSKLETHILTEWPKLDWGHEVNLTFEGSAAWLHYITKLRTKDDFGSNIDWWNTRYSP